MAKRCSTKTGCSYPRANWWKQSMGVDWFNQASSGGDTTRSISFTNPSPLHKIWRSGVERTGIITPPTGYSVVAWSIINHRTRDVVASGVSSTVTHTFTFASMEDCNVYDLLIVVSQGATMFNRIMPGEFTCLPVAPTVFDVTWNTSGDKNMGWTDRAGQAILATGNLTARLNPYWLKSDDPTNPVHIVLKDFTSDVGSVGNFHCTAFKNVIIDGCTEEDVEYGAIFTKNGAGTGAQFQLLGAEPNDNTKLGENVFIYGISADGGSITNSTGNTAFRLLNNRDAANNRLTFTFNNIVWAKCKGVRSWEEVAYVNQTDDGPDGSGFFYPLYTNGLFYDLHMETAGNECFQIGVIDTFDVFNCFFKDGGIRNQNLHENVVQISEGSANGAFYMNWVQQDTHNLLAFFTGQIGGDMEFFSNVFYSTGKDADGGGNIWGRLDLHDTELTLNYTFRHNTIVYTTGFGFTLYEATATDWDKFNSTANIVVGASTQTYENASGVDPAHVVFDNLYKLTANIADVLFVDAANKNYKLTSLLSPAFRVNTATAMVSPLAVYDYEGYEYVEDVAGAYSGFELLI